MEFIEFVINEPKDMWFALLSGLIVYALIAYTQTVYKDRQDVYRIYGRHSPTVSKQFKSNYQCFILMIKENWVPILVFSIGYIVLCYYMV